MKLICAPGVVVAERYDDELAERRASAGRHMGPAEGADAATAALPLQWDDNASDDEDDRSAESDERDDPGDDHEPTATTIDLTERAARSGRDDLSAWSGVLGGRPGRT
ncbi:MAG: hypothetical protein ACRDY7_06260, partial [Acidimicrobiia bacterium]